MNSVIYSLKTHDNEMRRLIITELYNPMSQVINLGKQNVYKNPDPQNDKLINLLNSSKTNE